MRIYISGTVSPRMMPTLADSLWEELWLKAASLEEHLLTSMFLRSCRSVANTVIWYGDNRTHCARRRPGRFYGRSGSNDVVHRRVRSKRTMKTSGVTKVVSMGVNLPAAMSQHLRRRCHYMVPVSMGICADRFGMVDNFGTLTRRKPELRDDGRHRRDREDAVIFAYSVESARPALLPETATLLGVWHEHGLSGQGGWAAATTRITESPASFMCDLARSTEANKMVRKGNRRNVPARFQVEIMREELEEMERLRELGGLSSKKELLNNALTLLKWAVRQKEQGFSIASVYENGEVRRELEMPYLESVGLKSQRPLKIMQSAASAADDDRLSDETETDDRATHPQAAIAVRS